MENIVNRQIEMISVCAADGALTPIRFRMEDLAKNDIAQSVHSTFCSISLFSERKSFEYF